MGLPAAQVGRDADLDGGVIPSLDGIEGIGDDVEHGPRDPLRVEEHPREIGRRVPADRRARFLGAVVDGLDDVGDQRDQIGRHRVGLALLAEGEHVHDERGDLVLVAGDDVPALLDDAEILVFQSHLHEVAAAADPLEDVLDVVGEGGDGVADGRESLRLNHGGVVGGVLDREGGLVPDRNHELEVLVAEAALPGAERVGQRGRGVDIQDPDRAVAPPHRHADRLADAGPQDAVAGAEAVVILGVARQHPFAMVENVVEDRPADDHRGDVGGTPVATGLRLQLAAVGVEEHDASAVGLDPLEDELEDPPEELVDVEGVADGQRRSVHHLEVAAGPGQPAVVGVAVGSPRRAVEDVVLEGRDNPRPLLGGLRHDVDLGTDLVAGRVGGGIAGIGEEGAADEDLVAVVELRPLDPPAVDEAAVGALQVADHVGFTDLADLGVPPRDLVVFQLDDVARLAADADGPLAGGEVEPCAAVAALDDKQGRHGEGALEGGRWTRPSAEIPLILAHRPAGGKRLQSLRGWGGREGRMWIQFPRGARWDAGAALHRRRASER